MSSDLHATGRIKFPYTVNNLAHVAHFYVRNPQLVGGVYKINSRALDENDILWTDAAQGVASAWNGIAPNSCTYGTCELQLHSSPDVWTTVATCTVTATVSGSALAVATQMTATFRTKLNNHVRVIFNESIEAQQPKATSPTAWSANADSFFSRFVSTSADANAPFAWMVGKDNQFLASSPFISAVVTLNRKLRRARGYA